MSQNKPFFSLGELLDISRCNQVKFECYSILTNPDTLAVYLLPDSNGWTTPHFSLEPHFWQNIHPVSQELQKLLNTRTRVVRCLDMRYDPNDNRVTNLYAVECENAHLVPTDSGQWITRDELSELEFAMPITCDLLEYWFNWIETENKVISRVPWYKLGWSKTVNSWIQSELRRFRAGRILHVEQMRSWEMSSIMRVNTSRGSYYFKAVPATIAHEPELTELLAKRYPSFFPQVLSVENEQHWYLMPEILGTTLDRVTDVSQWEKVLSSFARIQIDLINDVDTLLATGCADRRLEKLAEQIEPLFVDITTQVRQSTDFQAAETEEISALSNELRDRCSKLADYDIPCSIEHGDFWSQQVMIYDGRTIFLDWAYSSITHPFFSLSNFIMEIENELPHVPNVRTRLRDAYLEPWTVYEPMDRLIEAYETSQLLGIVHYILTFYQLIPKLEVQWELKNTMIWYLKQLFRRTSISVEQIA